MKKYTRKAIVVALQNAVQSMRLKNAPGFESIEKSFSNMAMYSLFLLVNETDPYGVCILAYFRR